MAVTVGVCAWFIIFWPLSTVPKGAVWSRDHRKAVSRLRPGMQVRSPHDLICATDGDLPSGPTLSRTPAHPGHMWLLYALAGKGRGR